MEEEGEGEEEEEEEEREVGVVTGGGTAGIGGSGRGRRGGRRRGAGWTASSAGLTTTALRGEGSTAAHLPPSVGSQEALPRQVSRSI